MPPRSNTLSRESASAALVGALAGSLLTSLIFLSKKQSNLVDDSINVLRLEEDQTVEETADESILTKTDAPTNAGVVFALGEANTNNDSTTNSMHPPENVNTKTLQSKLSNLTVGPGDVMEKSASGDGEIAETAETDDAAENEDKKVNENNKYDNENNTKTATFAKDVIDNTAKTSNSIDKETANKEFLRRVSSAYYDSLEYDVPESSATKEKSKGVHDSDSFEQVSPAHSSSDDEDAEPDQVYLDYNGTTPVYKPVLEAMMPYFTEHYGNPSSSHFAGQQPKLAVDNARRSILKLLNKSSGSDDNDDLSSVIFTSCGTESNNMAIQMALEASSKKSKKAPHIVTTNVEHPAITNYLNILKNKGQIKVSEVPVKGDGRVVAQDVIKAIRPTTVLVTVMLANNETGAVMPIQEIARHCRSARILFHTDAAQAVGKIDIASAVVDADMVTIVGHKIGAPKGVACLYVRSGCLAENDRKMHNHGIFFEGGGQEFGRRSGTENVPYIVGLGKAAEMAASDWETNNEHMNKMRERLIEKLHEKLYTDYIRVNGPATERLPNTLSVSIKGINSAELLSMIGDKIAATSGASCHSNSGVSSVLKAMEVPEEFAAGTLRLTCGPKTRECEIDKAVDEIVAAVTKLNESSVKQQDKE